MVSQLIGYISDTDLAEFLGIEKATFDKRRREGKMPAHSTVGNRTFYSVADVQGWLQARKVETEEVEVLDAPVVLL